MSDKFDESDKMPDGLDIYNPKERFIFRYFNGEKVVPADPMVLQKRLTEKIQELSSDIKVANVPQYPGSKEAYESLCANIRLIFKIKPLDQGGLTETELEELLSKFVDYCNWAKKKLSPTPTSQETTSQTFETSSAGSQPTSNFSVSTSTEIESPTDGPRRSPSALESPTSPSAQAWSIG